MNPTIIPPEEWSRDHWTTIAYAFTRLGRGGELELQRLRLDGTTYPTKTRSGTVAGHTDLDCIADAQEAGVLSNIGTGIHPVVQFTPAGLVLGQWLCRAMVTQMVKTASLTWEVAILASGFKVAADVHRAAEELRQIDAVMARIPALDKPTRWQNVQHAIQTAKRADELEARVSQLELGKAWRKRKAPLASELELGIVLVRRVDEYQYLARLDCTGDAELAQHLKELWESRKAPKAPEA